MNLPGGGIRAEDGGGLVLDEGTGVLLIDSLGFVPVTGGEIGGDRAEFSRGFSVN